MASRFTPGASGTAVWLVAVAFSCSSKAPSNRVDGSEGGHCYRNSTCNEGLSCLSNFCVALPDAGNTASIVSDAAATGKTPDAQPSSGSDRDAAISPDLDASVGALPDPDAAVSTHPAQSSETGASIPSGNQPSASDDAGGISTGTAEPAVSSAASATPTAAGSTSAAPEADAVSSLAAGPRNTCAVLNSGLLRCWGNNDVGQTGYVDGKLTAYPKTMRYYDVAGNVENVAAVTIGTSHICALQQSGSVLCWGGNSSGQMGVGTEFSYQAGASAAVLLQQAAVAIGAGGSHTCAILVDGAVWCWGSNAHGAVGGNALKVSTPIKRDGLPGSATAVAGGRDHTCSLDSDGGVSCWGGNTEGQLGDGTTEERTTPVTVLNLPQASQIASGWVHNCALLTDGTVQCWGANSAGQLGDGTTEARPEAVEVAGLTDVIAIGAGSTFSCALRSEGKIYCWGAGASGHLGHGAITDQLVPELPVKTYGTASFFAVGSSHACGAWGPTDVRCWGLDNEGQLGEGAYVTYRNDPTAVSSIVPP